MSQEKSLDDWWSWLVLIGGFLSLMLNGALACGAGIIHLALLKEFEESDTFTSFTGSVYSSLMYITAPVASLLMNIFNCRVTMIVGGVLISAGLSLTYFAESLTFVVLTYGIAAGIGNGLTATPPLVSIGYYFDRTRSFAIGFAVAGAGIGTLISGPLFQNLIDSFGLRGAFLILGGCGANQIVFGALMKPCSKVHKSHDTLGESRQQKINKVLQDMYDFNILKEKTFLLILAHFLVWTIPVSFIMLHLPNFAVTQGASNDDAAFLLLLIGLTGTMGRLLSGSAVGPDGIDPLLMNVGQTGIAGIVTLLFMPFLSSYSAQCIFAAIFGFYHGGLASLITPLLVDILGLSKLSSAVGMIFFVGGVGYITGPTLAGFIIDRGGTYHFSFYISGIMVVISSLLSLLSSVWRKELKKECVANELKNSSFLAQSGLLAGSMILQTGNEGKHISEDSVQKPFLERDLV